MSDIAIKVENISKRYRIGMKEEMQDTLFGALSSWVKYPISNFKRLQKLSKFDNSQEQDDIIWAVQDVSFDVRRGEVLGIIGKNGAGKSTLLKILCRITEPSSGRAIMNGRIASLLEVGTGFHSELTGRENVFLNGTILGMKKSEVISKFDEIVEFSGVEKFIDTPVKRYSSGMRVRLAFAVAAHLEPEILLIDEVLAVGDVAFQKKCMGKMGDIAQGGRTILFVSHNMGAIRQLCPRSLLIEDGRVIADDTSEIVVGKYLNNESTLSKNVDLTNWKNRTGSGLASFKAISISTDGENISENYFIGDTIQMNILIESEEIINSVHMSVNIRDSQGLNVLLSSNLDGNLSISLKEGVNRIIVKFDDIRLYPDTYYIILWLADISFNKIDKVEDCIKFSILEGGSLVRRRLPKTQAVYFATPTWTIIR